MNTLNYKKYTLKPDYCTELLPEHREEINNDVGFMCLENAELGYKQGFKKGVMITTAVVIIWTTIYTITKTVANKKDKKEQVLI